MKSQGLNPPVMTKKKKKKQQTQQRNSKRKSPPANQKLSEMQNQNTTPTQQTNEAKNASTKPHHGNTPQTDVHCTLIKIS